MGSLARRRTACRTGKRGEFRPAATRVERPPDLEEELGEVAGKTTIVMAVLALASLLPLARPGPALAADLTSCTFSSASISFSSTVGLMPTTVTVTISSPTMTCQPQVGASFTQSFNYSRTGLFGCAGGAALGGSTSIHGTSVDVALVNVAGVWTLALTTSTKTIMGGAVFIQWPIETALCLTGSQPAGVVTLAAAVFASLTI